MRSNDLFKSVPDDYFKFGHGADFKPKEVANTLDFKREELSKIVNISVKSVRWDENIPYKLKERLEEIASTINTVANIFNGDINKTTTWFKTNNPMLGGVSPRDMIRFGKYEKLRKFIISSIEENN
ncbi:hypothetical protein HZU83_22010 [Sphaerotilus montanus]|uniref:hypothetical protein n=1 Tax=Sphaerotilus montanus TaxID=522889 RepID=UPI0015D6C1C2|nr:hypothetical protein [Sphaerotilus montanus]NZD59357.1 hypothetical protein [Sphaerotilus montanus]